MITRIRRLAVMAICSALLALLAVVVSAPAGATSHRHSPLYTRSFTSNGRHYVVRVWAKRSHQQCWRHAYGQVQDYLSVRPGNACGVSLDRLYATTKVNGQWVGVQYYGSTFGSSYRAAGGFTTLVRQDGTGMYYTLRQEGVPGARRVPGSAAFRALSQDTAVDIFQIWYLYRPTPSFAPALKQAAADLWLHVY